MSSPRGRCWRKKWRGAQVALFAVPCFLTITAQGWKMQAPRWVLCETRSCYAVPDSTAWSSPRNEKSGTQQSGDTKMKMCLALTSLLSEIMLEVIVFLVTIRQATYSTRTSLPRSHSVSALWMIQTPRCWQQGKGAFSPLIVQHTALHLTCCMPSVPALRTKLLTSTVTLLWHFAPQPQIFTMIHLLCQLPVGFLVAILQMYSETKLIFFCEFWELSMRCHIV